MKCDALSKMLSAGGISLVNHECSLFLATWRQQKKKMLWLFADLFGVHQHSKANDWILAAKC